MKLYRAAVLIALLGFSTFAQEVSRQSESERNWCVWNNGAQNGVKRASSQSGKTNVEVLRSETHPLKSKCNFLSFALPRAIHGLKQINNEAIDPVPAGELFSFESRLAKSKTIPA